MLPRASGLARKANAPNCVYPREAGLWCGYIGEYFTSPMHIDLSHTIEHGMITYKGLPAPLICDYLSREASRSRYAAGTEFHIGRIDMVANTGTYLDSPFHRFADGKDLAELPLGSLAGLDGLLVRAPAVRRAVSRDVFEGLSLSGRAVLVHTGWDL